MAQDYDKKSMNWEDFQHELQGSWDNLKVVELDEGRNDLEELTRKIHNKTGEAKVKVRKQVQSLANQCNYHFYEN